MRLLQRTLYMYFKLVLVVVADLNPLKHTDLEINYFSAYFLQNLQNKLQNYTDLLEEDCVESVGLCLAVRKCVML